MIKSIEIQHQKWITGRPQNWKTKRYKEIFLERNERSETGEELLLSVSAYTGVTPRSDLVDDGDLLSRADSLIDYKKCYPGDLVMNIMLAWNKGLAFTNMEGIVSPAYAVFKVTSNDNPKFLNYLLRDEETNLYFKAYSTGIIDSRLRLYPEIFNQMYCSLPDFDTQAQIADFLDRETAKIDELIQKQEKLIELLCEEQKSEIKHAVTKGLNQSVALKNSEIQWIGNIPAHWKVSPLKRLINIQNGSDHKSIETEDGFPVYGSGGIFSYANDYLYDGESILLGRKGTIDKPLYVNGKFWTVDTMYWSKILPTAYAKFVYYLATIIPFEYYSTSTALPSMTKGDLGSHMVAYPDIEEQKQISAYLDKALSKTDDLISKAKLSIELLKEHRASLISAAVTGKIDLRESV